MKKIIPLLLIPCFSFCQNNVHILKDTAIWTPSLTRPNIHWWAFGVVLSNGQVVAKGGKIRLLKGSLPNGDYNYIATPSNSMESKLHARTKLKEMTIEEILRTGKKRYGYRYVFKSEGNYLIQLEDAISAGEIEVE